MVFNKDVDNEWISVLVFGICLIRAYVLEWRSQWWWYDHFGGGMYRLREDCETRAKSLITLYYCARALEMIVCSLYPIEERKEDILG